MAVLSRILVQYQLPQLFGITTIPDIIWHSTPIHIPYLPGDSPVAAVDQMLREREDILKVLQFQLRKAQARMKFQVDKHQVERSFVIGDWVLLKLQPYRQLSVSGNRVQKLSPKYYGPFKVLDTIGNVAYKLDLPSEAQIHDIFHVSQLRKAVGYQGPFVPLLVNSQQQLKWEPLVVLDRKLVKRGNRAEAQLLIHWKNLSPAEATWEFASEIRRRFPSFFSLRIRNLRGDYLLWKIV